MEVKKYTVKIADGRELDVVDVGEKNNPVIVFNNGTPGAPGLLTTQVEDAVAKGIRLITYGRPGYGKSTSCRGRTVASAAKDIAELTEILGIDRYAVMGLSGGGPHTLACGALNSDRVVGLACVSGIAPYGAEGLDFMDGMGEGNLVEFGAALKGEEELINYLERARQMFSQIDAKSLAAHMKSLLCQADLRSFEGRNGLDIADNIIGGANSSIYGWLDDDLAFIRPWGFNVTDITVPVQIWQGSEDLMVPFSHGKWLANNIPGAESHLIDNEGHMSVLFKYITEIHDWLLKKF